MFGDCVCIALGGAASVRRELSHGARATLIWCPMQSSSFLLGVTSGSSASVRPGPRSPTCRVTASLRLNILTRLPWARRALGGSRRRSRFHRCGSWVAAVPCVVSKLAQSVRDAIGGLPRLGRHAHGGGARHPAARRNAVSLATNRSGIITLRAGLSACSARRVALADNPCGLGAQPGSSAHFTRECPQVIQIR